MMQYWMERFQKAAQAGCYDIPLYHSHGSLHAKSITDYTGFLSLPFTYKQEIREASSADLTAAEPSEVFGLFSSSGTTGDKTYFTFTFQDKAVHTECAAAYLGGIGITAEDLGGVLAPIGQGMMGQTMIWQFTACGAGYINCPMPSPEAVTDLIARFPVTVLAGLPNTMAAVPASSAWNAVAAQQSTVKRLLMGGDYLSSQKRRMLEQSWHAECYNLFGFSEVFGPMASECKQKDGLHFLPQYFFIEVIDPDSLQPVAPGEIGIAVYTTLWNKGFPLLRYWSDDFVSLSFDDCPCGCGLPRFWFHGRMADAFKNNRGQWVLPSDVEPVLAEASFSGIYRIVRKANQYTLELEYAGEYGPEWLQVQKKLSALVGSPVSLQFLQQGAILRGKGKYKRFTEDPEP